MSADLHLLVRRTIAASPARLYEAWTTPALLMRWWGPEGVRCTGASVDPRVGGSYAIDNQLPDGSQLTIRGEFLALEPPHRLVFTWRTREAGPPERVTVRLQAQADTPGVTEVIVEHERIGDPETAAQHEHGWRGCLAGLERLAGWLAGT